MVKYSIIIPVRNAAAYLPTCVETVLSQSYADFELIISDNHSTDGTGAYLHTLNHPNLRKIMPPEPCCMSMHWEWALSQATGKWLIFLGADDGLLPYFFELADTLTTCAAEKGIHAVMSRRAYYFWPGCESLCGKTVVSYIAQRKTEVRRSLIGTLNALFGIGQYFDLPQMYANSLFHRSLIEGAIRVQGHVFTTISPDANLAAIACGLHSRYLFSRIPLGWVGSSPASNGFSVSVASLNTSVAGVAHEEQKARSTDFFTLNDRSVLRYDARLGNPRLSSSRFLFLDALYKTEALRSDRLNRALFSTFVRSLVIAKELEEAKGDVARTSNAKSVASTYGIDWKLVRVLCVVVRLVSFPFKVKRRLLDVICRYSTTRSLSYYSNQRQSMPDAAQSIMREMRRRNLLRL